MHPDYAACLNNLAELKVARGRYRRGSKAVRPSPRDPRAGPGTRSQRRCHAPAQPGRHQAATRGARLAEGLYRHALAIDEKALGKDHPTLVLDLGGLASALKAVGKGQEAKSALDRSVIILREHLGPDHPLTKAAIERRESLQ